MLEVLQRLSSSQVRLLSAVVVLLVGYLVYRGLSRALARLAAQGQIQQSMEGRLRVVLRLLVLLLTVLLAVAGAGVVSHAWALISAFATTIAIGFFAIWSVLSNGVCALLILLFRPFRVGDWIEILEGAPPYPGGRVVDMNLLFISLRDEHPPVSELRIPNTLVFQKIIRHRASTERHRGNTFYG
jgi:small-conductance mechanosensitive channel